MPSLNLSVIKINSVILKNKLVLSRANVPSVPVSQIFHHQILVSLSTDTVSATQSTLVPLLNLRVSLMQTNSVIIKNKLVLSRANVPCVLLSQMFHTKVLFSLPIVPATHFTLVPSPNLSVRLARINSVIVCATFKLNGHGRSHLTTQTRVRV